MKSCWLEYLFREKCSRPLWEDLLDDLAHPPARHVMGVWNVTETHHHMHVSFYSRRAYVVHHKATGGLNWVWRIRFYQLNDCLYFPLGSRHRYFRPTAAMNVVSSNELLKLKRKQNWFACVSLTCSECFLLVTHCVFNSVGDFN